jgi:hypothetical protein
MISFKLIDTTHGVVGYSFNGGSFNSVSQASFSDANNNTVAGDPDIVVGTNYITVENSIGEETTIYFDMVDACVVGTEDSAERAAELEGEESTEVPYIKTQQGELTMTTTSEDVTINEVTDLTKAFILISQRGQDTVGDQDMDEIHVTAEFVNGTTIRIKRHNTAEDCNVFWQVVEADPNADTPAFEVETGEVAFTGSDTTLSENIADITDTSNAIIIVQARATSDFDNRTGHLFYGTFNSSSQIQLTRGLSPGPVAVRYWVVKFSDDINVQKGSIDLTGTSGNDTFTEVDESRSIVMIQYDCNDEGLSQGSPRAWLSTPTANQINFARAGKGGNCHIEYYVIEFPVGAAAQYEASDWGDPTSGDTTSIFPVDLDHTFITASNMCTGSGDAFPRPVITTALTDESTVTMTTSYTGQTNTVSWTLVDLSGWTYEAVNEIGADRFAELHGFDTDEIERDAEAHGSLDENIERDAELFGIATDDVERAAELTGFLTDEAEIDAEVFGSIDESAERAAELTGTDESWTIQRNKDSEGWVTIETALVIEEDGGLYIYDDDSTLVSGSQYCYRVKNHVDDSEWSNVSCVDYFSGETVTAERAAERAAELTGSEDTEAERDAELHGIDTDAAERDAELHGQDEAAGEIDAETHGQDTDAAERDAELHGIDTDSGEIDAELHGKDTDAAEIDAEVSGTDEATDERAAELHGKDTDSVERAAEAYGIDTDAAERAAELTGDLASYGIIKAETHGQDTAAGEIDAEVTGSVPDSVERAAEAHGIDTTEAEIDAELHGKATDVDERQAETHGQDEATDERAAETHGQDEATGQIDAETIGALEDTAERAAQLSGLEESEAERAAELEGVAGAVGEIRAELRGAIGDPYCPDPGPYSDKASPYEKDQDVYNEPPRRNC